MFVSVSSRWLWRERACHISIALNPDVTASRLVFTDTLQKGSRTLAGSPPLPIYEKNTYFVLISAASG